MFKVVGYIWFFGLIAYILFMIYEKSHIFKIMKWGYANEQVKNIVQHYNKVQEINLAKSFELQNNEAMEMMGEYAKNIGADEEINFAITKSLLATMNELSQLLGIDKKMQDEVLNNTSDWKNYLDNNYKTLLKNNQDEVIQYLKKYDLHTCLFKKESRKFLNVSKKLDKDFENQSSCFSAFWNIYLLSYQSDDKQNILNKVMKNKETIDAYLSFKKDYLLKGSNTVVDAIQKKNLDMLQTNQAIEEVESTLNTPEIEDIQEIENNNINVKLPSNN